MCVYVCVSACACAPLSFQWNWIDFIVVVGGFISLLPGIGNISALRIIRVMRPLRTLKRIKKLKIMVMTLIGSMKQLANVALLILFLFTVYSIIGIQVGNPCPSFLPVLLTVAVGCVSACPYSLFVDPRLCMDPRRCLVCVSLRS